MDNGAEYYRCFLNGDKEALNKLIHEYWDGLALYLSSLFASFPKPKKWLRRRF